MYSSRSKGDAKARNGSRRDTAGETSVHSGRELNYNAVVRKMCRRQKEEMENEKNMNRKEVPK